MLTDTDRLRARFRENDIVTTGKRNPVTGPIIRMNRTTATVQCDSSGDQYLVPFELLQHLDSSQSRDATPQLEAVAALAATLLKEFQLSGWIFRFDYSTRRAGCCDYRRKKISIAFDLARNGSNEDIRDTLLHEIAHALVGKKHNHGPVWKAKAREIGCSGERTHRLVFSPPRYRIACENGCWEHTAERRKQHLRCRTCHGKIIYSPYTAPTA